MQSTLHYFVAASMLTGSIAFAQQANDNVTAAASPANSGVQASATTGQPLSSIRTSNDVRHLLAVSTDQALTRNGFNDLVRHFSREDRDRIGMDHNYPDLNDAIARFQDDWRQRYGSSFDMRDSSTVIGDDYRVSLESGSSARTAGQASYGTREVSVRGSEENPINLRSSSNKDRPLGADAIIRGANDQPLAWDRDTGQVVVIRRGQLASDRISGEERITVPANSDIYSSAETAGEVQSGDHAMLFVPASGSLDATQVRLVQEGGAWKLDVPDTLTAEDLHRSLLYQINLLDENKANWPDDQIAAKRIVMHHIMDAIYRPEMAQ